MVTKIRPRDQGRPATRKEGGGAVTEGQQAGCPAVVRHTLHGDRNPPADGRCRTQVKGRYSDP